MQSTRTLKVIQLGTIFDYSSRAHPIHTDQSTWEMVLEGQDPMRELCMGGNVQGERKTGTE